MTEPILIHRQCQSRPRPPLKREGPCPLRSSRLWREERQCTDTCQRLMDSDESRRVANHLFPQSPLSAFFHNVKTRQLLHFCRLVQKKSKKRRKCSCGFFRLRLDHGHRRGGLIRSKRGRAISSVGRAPRLHRGCREFESLIAHHFFLGTSTADSTSAFAFMFSLSNCPWPKFCASCVQAFIRSSCRYRDPRQTPAQASTIERPAPFARCNRIC